MSSHNLFRFIITAFLCLGLTVSPGGFALAEISKAEEPSEFLKQCRLIKKQSNLSTVLSTVFSKLGFSVFRDSGTQVLMVSGLNVEQIVELVHNRGLSKRLTELLYSDLYTADLDICFGGNLAAKQAFVVGLVISELGGRALGAGVVVAAGLAATKIIAALKLGMPSVYQGVRIGGGILATMSAVQILHETFRNATPEEKRQIEKILAQTDVKTEGLVEQVRSLLRNKIATLDNELCIRRLDGQLNDGTLELKARLLEHLDRL